LRGLNLLELKLGLFKLIFGLVLADQLVDAALVFAVRVLVVLDRLFSNGNVVLVWAL